MRKYLADDVSGAVVVLRLRVAGSVDCLFEATIAVVLELGDVANRVPRVGLTSGCCSVVYGVFVNLRHCEMPTGVAAIQMPAC